MAAKEFTMQRVVDNNNEAIIEHKKATGKYVSYIAAVCLSNNSISLNNELVAKGFTADANY